MLICLFTLLTVSSLLLTRNLLKTRRFKNEPIN
jgi:hypothetical protein